MRFTLTYILLFILPFSMSGQSFGDRYSMQVNAADSLYKASDFKKAAKAYNLTFRENGDLAYLPDRYSAASAWAMANEPDSAFFHLFRIIERVEYDEPEKVENDSSFLNLHKHPRWTMVINRMRENKQQHAVLVAILDSVFEDDQRFRLKVEETEKRFGRASAEMKILDSLITTADSINEIKVIEILEKHGWPRQHIIGERGIAIFLVIQHSDLQVQERFLPQIRKAVADGDLEADKLALIEDRIAVNRGECQTFGTQIGFDEKSQQHYVSPILNPEHVDERRKKIGLGPLNEYVSKWKIKWEPGKHKKLTAKILGRKANCYK